VSVRPYRMRLLAREGWRPDLRRQHQHLPLFHTSQPAGDVARTAAAHVARAVRTVSRVDQACALGLHPEQDPGRELAVGVLARTSRRGKKGLAPVIPVAQHQSLADWIGPCAWSLSKTGHVLGQRPESQGNNNAGQASSPLEPVFRVPVFRVPAFYAVWRGAGPLSCVGASRRISISRAARQRRDSQASRCEQFCSALILERA
jgi:hypothetical protein